MQVDDGLEEGRVPREKRGSVCSGLLEWLGVFLIAFVVFVIVRTFVMSPYMVPSGSMEPTIKIGDNVFAQKVTANLGWGPERGDIIVFDNPVADSEHDILVKRVVALGGQTVDLIDGLVYVDGVALDEPYVAGRSYPLDITAPGVDLVYPYTVPEGCVWVMGDNRENSADSRYFGPVSRDEVIGTVFFRYWPVSRMGAL